MDGLELAVNDLLAQSSGAVGRLRRALRAAWDGDDRAGVDRALDRLAAAASGGSRDAAEQLVWAVDALGLARSAIRRVLIDDHDVDEATQRTLVSVNRGIDAFKGGARFRTWLFTVARNEALQVVRSRARQPTRPSAMTEDPPQGFVARMSSIIADRQLIHGVIEQLPEPFRSAVVLRDVEQCSYNEVAARLGVELGTVKSRIRRGRELAAARLVELTRDASDR
jgi:RNA polymerase sigma-70 factor (ECF subfamily)